MQDILIELSVLLISPAVRNHIYINLFPPTELITWNAHTLHHVNFWQHASESCTLFTISSIITVVPFIYDSVIGCRWASEKAWRDRNVSLVILEKYDYKYPALLVSLLCFIVNFWFSFSDVIRYIEGDFDAYVKRIQQPYV